MAHQNRPQNDIRKKKKNQIKTLHFPYGGPKSQPNQIKHMIDDPTFPGLVHRIWLKIRPIYLVRSESQEFWVTKAERQTRVHVFLWHVKARKRKWLETWD